MRGLLCGTNAQTNEEYRQVIKRRMKFMAGLIVIGILTAGIAIYTEFFTEAVLESYILGVYSGVGTGLALSGLLLLIKHILLLNNEEKLKESRLNCTDERLREIGDKAFRAAAYVMIAVLYVTVLIGGIFYPELVRFLILVMAAFMLAYAVSYSYYNRKM